MHRVLAIAILAAAAGSTAAAQQPIEIPLTVHHGRLLVPVRTADGTTLQFVLNPGGTATVFSASGAARAGDRAGLTLGGVPVPTDDSRTIPDEHLTGDGLVYDGRIGANLLNQFDVLIDAPGHRLVLQPISASVRWEGMTLTDPTPVMVFHGMLMAFEVELDGRTFRATIDLSAPALVVNRAAQTGLGIGDEGVATLGMGDTTLPDLPVRVRDLDIFRRWDPNGDGFVLVGASATHDCAMALSWAHREIRTCAR